MCDEYLAPQFFPRAIVSTLGNMFDTWQYVLWLEWMCDESTWHNTFLEQLYRHLAIWHLAICFMIGVNVWWVYLAQYFPRAIVSTLGNMFDTWQYALWLEWMYDECTWHNTFLEQLYRHLPICFMIGVNVWCVYLVPQYFPRAIVLTLGNMFDTWQYALWLEWKCDECAWHLNTFLEQLYRHLAICLILGNMLYDRSECVMCTWHYKTFLKQLYWHSAIKLYCIKLYWIVDPVQSISPHSNPTDQRWRFPTWRTRATCAWFPWLILHTLEQEKVQQLLAQILPSLLHWSTSNCRSSSNIVTCHEQWRWFCLINRFDHNDTIFIKSILLTNLTKHTHMHKSFCMRAHVCVRAHALRACV